MPGMGRDGCRTPMEWDTSVNGGFSTSEPWLAVAEGWQTRNVASQGESSHLAFYRRMLALRRATPALTLGKYRPLDAADDCFAFERTNGTDRYVVVLNFGGVDRHVDLSGTIVLSTRLDTVGPAEHLHVRPKEGIVVRL